MAQLSTSRTTANTPAEHISDHTQIANKLNGLVFDVKADFGALGDDSANDTAAIQAAITAAADGGTVFFPPGTYRYTALTVSQVHDLTLEGRGATLRKTTTTGNGVIFTGTSIADPMLRLRIVGLTFDASGTQTADSFLRLSRVNHAIFENITMLNGFIGLTALSCLNLQISNFLIDYMESRGVVWEANTGEGRKAIDLFMSDGIIGGIGANLESQQSRIGLLINSGSTGIYVNNVDIVGGDNGVVVANDHSADEKPEWLFFNSTLVDSTMGKGWSFIAGKSAELHNCWASTCGQTGSGAAGVECASGFSALRIFGGSFYNNGKQGIALEGGSDHLVTGTTVSENATKSVNGHDGIVVAAGVSGFRLVGNRCGNITGLGSGGTQRYGIAVLPGASDNYVIANNDLRSNGTGGLSDGGTGTVKAVVGNIPTASDDVAFVTPADGETILYVKRNVGGTITQQRVSMGAADSGGVGFKLLRVPN